MNDDNPASKHKRRRNGRNHLSAARAAALHWRLKLNMGNEESLAGTSVHCRRTYPV